MKKTTNKLAKAMFEKHQVAMREYDPIIPDMRWTQLFEAERVGWRALAKEHILALAEKERKIKRLFGVEGA